MFNVVKTRSIGYRSLIMSTNSFFEAVYAQLRLNSTLKIICQYKHWVTIKLIFLLFLGKVDVRISDFTNGIFYIWICRCEV